jgi:hypothetical protein
MSADPRREGGRDHPRDKLRRGLVPRPFAAVSRRQQRGRVKSPNIAGALCSHRRLLKTDLDTAGPGAAPRIGTARKPTPRFPACLLAGLSALESHYAGHHALPQTEQRRGATALTRVLSHQLRLHRSRTWTVTNVTMKAITVPGWLVYFSVRDSVMLNAAWIDRPSTRGVALPASTSSAAQHGSAAMPKRTDRRIRQLRQ